MKKVIIPALVIFTTAVVAKPIDTRCEFFDSKVDLTKEDVQQSLTKAKETIYCEKYFIEKKGSKVKIYKVDDLVMWQVGSLN